MSGTPSLSVIVASYNARTTIESCLRSLEHQAADKFFEVIVVDSSSDGTARIVAQKFPWVQLHAFPERKYCGEARNFGISVARADIVAFLDADCTADSRWVQETLRAHQEDVLAVGGSIANANPESYVGWAAYFCEFSSWMPAQGPGWQTDIAGANMSYKKSAFAGHGRFIEGTYCSDTEFHWRLERAGLRLRFEPSIRVAHKNIEDLKKFLCHEFLHGRFFVRVRVRYRGFSRARRAVYALFFVLIFLKLFLKITGDNIKNRVYGVPYLRALPLVMLGVFSWSLGEAAGYAKNHD